MLETPRSIKNGSDVRLVFVTPEKVSDGHPPPADCALGTPAAERMLPSNNDSRKRVFPGIALHFPCTRWRAATH